MGLKPMPVQGKTCAKEKGLENKGKSRWEARRHGTSCRDGGRFCTVSRALLLCPRAPTDNRPMHPPTFQNKAEARAWALQRRAAISESERNAIASMSIARLLASPLFSQADALLTYVGSKGTELDTRSLIEEAIAMGKSVLVPVTRPGGVMLWSQLERLADLEMTARGILEPRLTAISWVEPADGLCVVPGVCFRRDGHRIGFGGGYYDRFLGRFSGKSIALAPEALFGVDFPVEDHDRAVSIIFTESAAHVGTR